MLIRQQILYNSAQRSSLLIQKHLGGFFYAKKQHNVLWIPNHQFRCLNFQTLDQLVNNKLGYSSYTFNHLVYEFHLIKPTNTTSTYLIFYSNCSWKQSLYGWKLQHKNNEPNIVHNNQNVFG